MTSRKKSFLLNSVIALAWKSRLWGQTLASKSRLWGQKEIFKKKLIPQKKSKLKIWLLEEKNSIKFCDSIGLEVATLRPNIGLKVATLRPMFRFGKVTHTYLASTSPGLNVVWPQRRLASTSSGLNVVWPHCRWPQRRGLKVAWPQCPIGSRPASIWKHLNSTLWAKYGKFAVQADSTFYQNRNPNKDNREHLVGRPTTFYPTLD